MRKSGAWAALIVVLVVAGGCRAGVVTNVVDGDTVDVDGVRVRLQGIDTPERGQCGYAEATNRVRQLVDGRNVLVVNGGGDERDRYGREIGYVIVDERDVGTALVAEGLAIARYDGLDGYPRHRNQDLYRWLDGASPNRCGR
ncbi:MAG: thermonuclease family protein [Microthrixaceae bacterium]